MNAKTTKRARRIGGAGALALLLGAASVAAQQQQQRPQYPALDAARVRELVERALPSWDARVLEAKDGVDWSAKASPDLILRAVGDEPLARKDATGRRIVDGERVVRLYGERGKLRYINRARAWKVEQGSRRNVDGKRAEEAVRAALGRLGLPGDELARVSVVAQIAQGASVKQAAERQRFEMYQVVSVARRVNGLPVYGSKARGAVTHSGAIQRLQVNWPAFRVPRGLALRGREEVAAEVVRQIVAQQPGADTQVKAYLAYAPADLARADPTTQPTAGEEGEEKATAADARGDDETSHRHAQPPRFGSAEVRKEPVRFVPVVVVSVLSLPTPYQVVVAVANAR